MKKKNHLPQSIQKEGGVADVLLFFNTNAETRPKGKLQHLDLT